MHTSKNEYRKLAMQYAKTLDMACDLLEEKNRLTSKNHKLLSRVRHLEEENRQLRKIISSYDGSINIKG